MSESTVFTRLLFVFGLKASQHQQEINAQGKEGLSDDLFILLDWKSCAGLSRPTAAGVDVYVSPVIIQREFYGYFIAEGENINEGYGPNSNNLKEKKLHIK